MSRRKAPALAVPVNDADAIALLWRQTREWW